MNLILKGNKIVYIGENQDKLEPCKLQLPEPGILYKIKAKNMSQIPLKT